MQEDIESTEHTIALMEAQIKGTEENCSDLKEKQEKDYKLLRQILAGYLEPELIRIDGKTLGVAWGFEFCVPDTQSHTKTYFLVKKHGVSYSIETGESASGNAQRVTNLLTGLDDYLAELKSKLEDKKLHLTQLKEEIKGDNPYLKQVKQLESEITDLRKAIGD